MKKISQWILVCLFMLLGAAALPMTVSAATLNGGAVSKIAAKKVVTGNEDFSKFPEYTVSYIIDDSDKTNVGGILYGIVVPVEVSEKSVLYLDLLEASFGVSKVKANLYYDKECLEEVKNSYVTGGSRKYAKVEKPGTYYLLLGRDPVALEDDVQTTDTIKFRIYFYSAQDQVLKNGVWTALSNIDVNGTYYKIVIPSDGHIRVKGGTYNSDGEAEGGITLMLCDKNKASKYDCFTKMEGDGNGYFLKKGTYYLYTGRFLSYYKTAKISYTFCELGESPYVIKNGKSFAVNSGDVFKSEEYFKYKATSNGYVTVSALKGWTYGIYVTLCDSSLKNISGNSKWVINHGNYKGTAVYGVKKGQVYYLKVVNGQGIKLKLSATAIKEKSGSSRAKAVSLKSGKLVKGVIEAGEKTADWYKIKVTKKKKLTLNFKGEGYIKVFLCNKKGKTIKEGSLTDKKMVTYQKLEKGTYYIKVARGSSVDSGYYTLKWK